MARPRRGGPQGRAPDPSPPAGKSCTMHTIMSKQLHQRIALPLLRHVLETFNAGAMTSEQACSELCLSRSRLFAIRKEWLSAIRRGEDWKPSGSGGANKAPWTEELKAFLRQALFPRRRKASRRPPLSPSNVS